MATGNTPQAGQAAKPPVNPAVINAAAATLGKTTPPAEAPKLKAERVAETVKMADGRLVEFVGKRKMLKTSSVGADGSLSVKLDFRNGESVNFVLPKTLIEKFALHGAEQKLGDETAGTEKVEDMVLEVKDLAARLSKGEWGTVREPGGFAGASIVIRAIMEAKNLVGAEGKAKVTAFLDAKIEAAKTKGETLSRKALYDAFRNPNSVTGKIIERIEREERAGKSTINADAELAAL